MKQNFIGSQYEIGQINDIKNFVFAGKAIFTLESKKTFDHYTFKVVKSKSNPDLLFVNVLRGPDNLSSYTYLGVIRNNEFYLTLNSKYSSECLCFKAFDFFFKDLIKLHIHSKLGFYHMGICGKCGKPLTVPSSIEKGIGPICSNKN